MKSVEKVNALIAWTPYTTCRAPPAGAAHMMRIADAAISDRHA
jgi:hypothetical protein